MLFEALLLLALLSIGQIGSGEAEEGEALVSFSVDTPPAPQAPAPEEATPPPAAQAPSPDTAADTPVEPQPSALPPLPSALPAVRPALIPVPRDVMRDTDIAQLPRRRPDAPAASGPVYGPAAPGPSAGDSEVVGTAPDGSPLYAARWYTEPTDQEMSGYLSTALPGYALIACRTAPGWRVEDCEGMSEYPSGSNMLRAVLAMAWQFKVRPPRRGNQSLVGSWVRIRISYDRRGQR